MKPTARNIVFVANWKMNKSAYQVREFAQTFTKRLGSLGKPTLDAISIAVAPQSTHLALLAAELRSTPISVAAQNCGPDGQGAFTGEVSPLALSELGVKWVILGHSERRHVFHEDEPMLSNRVRAALHQNLGVIYCVGETGLERSQRQTAAIVDRQLESVIPVQSVDPARLVIAYEPVWAIGSGQSASASQIAEVHLGIRAWADRHVPGLGSEIRVLYGGSVKTSNIAELAAEPQIDGFLVGGASLDAQEFADLILTAVKIRNRPVTQDMELL